MPKTVKVRIPVAVDPQGRFYAYQWGDATGFVGIEHMDHLLEITDESMIGLGPSEVLHWLTAELPVPEGVEVVATVEPATS